MREGTNELTPQPNTLSLLLRSRVKRLTVLNVFVFYTILFYTWKNVWGRRANIRSLCYFQNKFVFSLFSNFLCPSMICFIFRKLLHLQVCYIVPTRRDRVRRGPVIVASMVTTWFRRNDSMREVRAENFWCFIRRVRYRALLLKPGAIEHTFSF